MVWDIGVTVPYRGMGWDLDLISHTNTTPRGSGKLNLYRQRASRIGLSLPLRPCALLYHTIPWDIPHLLRSRKLTKYETSMWSRGLLLAN